MGGLVSHPSAVTVKPSTEALVQWSLSGLLAIVFPKSKSSSYPAAVALAERADMYELQEVGKASYHVAGFGRSQGQAARAMELLRLVRGLKGLQVFVRGALTSEPWRLQKTLECYLAACGSTDPRAHCVVVVSESTLHAVGGGVRIGSMLDSAWQDVLRSGMSTRAFPCRYLLRRNFHFQPGHPSSEADQLQAGAVREGCDWCPNFNERKGEL